MSIFKKSVLYLENLPVPFVYVFLTLFFSATLRNFIEVFSDNSIINARQFYHYYLSYFSLALAIVLLFHLITRGNILKIIKIVFPSFIILIVAPLFDLFISGGDGRNIAYLMPEIHSDYFWRFFTFFGEYTEKGITFGMRFEIVLILLASFFYFFIKTSKLIKSFFGVFLLYVLIFVYCMFPVVIKEIFVSFGLEYRYSDALMIDSYLFCLFLFGLILSYRINKKYFIIILKDIRLFRLLHFEMMFILGVTLISKQTEFYIFKFLNFFDFIFVFISIAFAWLYSVMSNNIEDYEIDKISNKQRPLISSGIDRMFYKNLSWIFLFLALLYAFAVTYETFFLILLFIGNYFLYSMKPLRLKRVTILSKLLIALNSLAVFIIGYMFGTYSHMRDFPSELLLIFLIGFTLVLNFIDIKDYKGDKQEGIKTLPVLLGLKKSKLLIGLFFVFVYPMVYFVFKDSILILPAIALGIIQFYFVNKKTYNEIYIFLTYLFSLVLLFVYLFYK